MNKLLLTLLIAGHETTASALAWALERLVRHPAAWQRMRDEIAVGEDTYVDAVIKETLRLRPVFPIIRRRLTQPAEIGGWALPAGVAVVPCIYLIHRDSGCYPDPLAFRPERFLERSARSYSWIPFGSGVRRCIGASFALMEMKTALQVIGSSTHLQAANAAPERIARRANMFVPAEDALLIRR